MVVAIRDCMLAKIFPSIGAGLRQLGVNAVELALGPGFEAPALDGDDQVCLADPGAVAAYRAHLESLGIRACALLTARDLSLGSPHENTHYLARAVEIADGLGAGAVRVDSLMIPEAELSFTDRVRLTAEVSSSTIERTPQASAALALENHGKCGNNLAFLLNVFAETRHPRAGLTLDTGNVDWRGLPLSEVYGTIRLLSPYVRHTHVKSIDFPGSEIEKPREAGWEYAAHVCPLDEGDIDHGLIVRMLRHQGYEGALCIECEALFKYEDGEKPSVLQREVDYLQEILKKLAA
ncbi:MAG: sugar phosphate isomerase/epimerase [Candidatus Hydrogenedentes bacterium]|nr:sugar phosphate isomerase/epimerase [Candidatus Hydrogenedentota bacterium]